METFATSGFLFSELSYPKAHTSVSWQFSSLLASDEICACPFRTFLQSLIRKGSTPEATGGSGERKLCSAVYAFDLWRELERMRTSYAACETVEIKGKVSCEGGGYSREVFK